MSSRDCSRFKSLRFLLTNSKIPRDTKRLVAGVGEKKTQVIEMSGTCFRRHIESFNPVLQEPELVDGILKAIQSISDEARRALADPELSRESLLSGLSVSSL